MPLFIRSENLTVIHTISVFISQDLLKSDTHNRPVLVWGFFLIVPDSRSLNWTTYWEISLQEQYACVIRMIGEVEMAGHLATEKILDFMMILRNQSCTTLIYLFQFDKSAKLVT